MSAMSIKEWNSGTREGNSKLAELQIRGEDRSGGEMLVGLAQGPFTMLLSREDLTDWGSIDYGKGRTGDVVFKGQQPCKAWHHPRWKECCKWDRRLQRENPEGPGGRNGRQGMCRATGHGGDTQNS